MTKTIMVTGGTGYIGSQLIRDLGTDEQFKGNIIRIYDNLQRRNYQALMDLPSTGRYQFVEGDILDRITLAEALQDVWAVVHLAAVVTTPISFDHPEWTQQVNHWGTATVVDEAVKAGVERFIYACSASVYGPGGPFKESDQCRPVGPYSISKLQGEQALMESGQQRGLQATSLRLATTFGDAPGERFEAVANRFAYLAGVGKPLVVHGDGHQKRPLIHVRDASNAFRFCLANESTQGRILNVVTLNATVNDLVQAIHHTLPNASVRYTDQDVLTNVSFEVDGSQLESLGYCPEFTLEAGLKEIIQRLAALRDKPFSNSGSGQTNDIRINLWRE